MSTAPATVHWCAASQRHQQPWPPAASSSFGQASMQPRQGSAGSVSIRRCRPPHAHGFGVARVAFGRSPSASPCQNQQPLAQRLRAVWEAESSSGLGGIAAADGWRTATRPLCAGGRAAASAGARPAGVASGRQSRRSHCSRAWGHCQSGLVEGRDGPKCRVSRRAPPQWLPAGPVVNRAGGGVNTHQRPARD